MKLKIEQIEWDSAFNRNADPHSRTCFLVAKHWAEMMEAAIADGEKIELCAHRTLMSINKLPVSHGGMTNAQYIMILRLLGRAWSHGEELLAWHNRMNLN